MDVITTTAALAAVCQRLAQHPYVAVDTEFMRETTFWPKLCLIQLAGPGDALIVDPLAPGLDLQPFYDLMTDERVEKVFHAARQDIEIVFMLSKQLPKPVFDTQVAAMVCGFGDSISYGNLVKQIVGADIDKSSRFTDWSRRPLSEKQLVYALGDVTHLCKVYERLRGQLFSENRGEWLKDELGILTDPETYILRPEDSWRRLKTRVRGKRQFAALMELAAWRERVAQTTDVPRARVLRDEALYDIANQLPTDVNQLSSLRTLSDGFARSSRAKDIIEAVKLGLSRDPKTLPRLDEAHTIPPDKLALVELLKVLLKATAARHHVAPRLIADAEDIERIAMQSEPDVPAMKGWRRKMFGEDALQLKSGALAIAVKDGEVTTVAVQGRA